MNLYHCGLEMFLCRLNQWITRLLNCDLTTLSWAQVANLYHRPFLESNNNLVFDFDGNVHFLDLDNLSVL